MIYIHNLQSLKSYSLILFSILFLFVFACVISPLKTENSISLPPLDWSLCLLPLCSESFYSLQTTNVIKARGDTKATGVSYRLKHEASQHLFEVRRQHIYVSVYACMYIYVDTCIHICINIVLIPS